MTTYTILIMVGDDCVKDYETQLVPQIGDFVAITPKYAVKITKRLLSVSNNTVILWADEE